MKETLKISDRFNLIKKLGQGTFSFIYEAHDKKLQKNVALKIEKKDKNKSILIFEYNVLNVLKGLTHVCNVYDFVKNSEQNLIVMDLLGNNLAKVRKCLEENYNLKIAIQLLIEMLDAIEEVHNRGFIHRDVKASNFVLSQDNRHVYIVDFGLAKKHLDDNQNPVAQRKKADFRGTVSFASLNAHNNIDLSRRDDIWSLYFVILDFLNEKLKWREQKEYTMDEVKNIKTECLSNPEEKLWIVTKDIPEVRTIFDHIQKLGYKDKPNYALIRGQLKNIYQRNMDISQNMCPLPQLQSRSSQNGVQHIIISQHQNPQANSYPFMTGQPNFNQKGLQQLPPPSASVEFQTPERPSNHQRCVHQNHQTPNTPQTHMSLNNEDNAFSRASPNNLTTQGSQMQQQDQCGFPQFLMQTGQRKQQNLPTPNNMNNLSGPQSPLARTIGIKRKAAEPLTHEELRNVVSTEINSTDNKFAGDTLQHQQEQNKPYAQNKKGYEAQPAMRKRDSKKGQVNVIYDEQPLLQKPRLEGELLQTPNMNGAPNQMFYPFPSANGNCVNQHININQNFYLSPPFILFYNEQQDNPLNAGQELANPYANGQQQVQQHPNQLQQPPFGVIPQEGQHLIHPQNMINVHPQGQNLFTNKQQPMPMYHQNPMFDPSRLNRPGNINPFFLTVNEDMRRDDQKLQGGPFLITNQLKDQQPFIVQKTQGQQSEQMGQVFFGNKKPQYSYNPAKIEMKNGPIFRVETDRDLYQKVYQKNNSAIINDSELQQDQLIFVQQSRGLPNNQHAPYNNQSEHCIVKQ